MRSGAQAAEIASYAGAAEDTASRAPVTPIVEAAYTKPRLASSVFTSRSSVDDGATRKMRSRLCVAEATNQSSASSGIRFGVMMPEPPAAARSRAKRSTPYWSTGFQ